MNKKAEATKKEKFMLGIKETMSQVFDAEGRAVPVTLVRAEPLVVLGERTRERDGYRAVQVGAGKTRRIARPQRGFLKDLGNFRYIREFRTGQYEVRQRGELVPISVFSEGDTVEVRGAVKGRGFQGVVKRHGFHGGPRTHGQKHSEREPGSIGATAPQKVLKGKRMAGRMGGNTVCVKNLRVVKIDTEHNLLAISGALPGSRGTLLRIVAEK